ncbi:hypothetical protein NDU88_002067 [Pleurodeles waltl]|uniref:Uncharacterized protein n=1 Tax=Pleurodeles waltl TaxID=8319 RepID=A0AAV7UC31_PLEWA|nr:hypothetical protein NDU88_002067 [Pleurodeles waltl]
MCELFADPETRAAEPRAEREAWSTTSHLPAIRVHTRACALLGCRGRDGRPKMQNLESCAFSVRFTLGKLSGLLEQKCKFDVNYKAMLLAQLRPRCTGTGGVFAVSLSY